MLPGMRRLATTLLLLSVALALWAVPSASAGYWRHCGSQHHLGAGWYHVRAHRAHCGKARAVARRFTHKSFGGEEDAKPFGFSCSEDPAGVELVHVICRRSRHGVVQRVSFSFGA